MTSAERPEHQSAESGTGETGAEQTVADTTRADQSRADTTSADTTSADPTPADQSRADTTSVTVRRSPRYANFMILGAVIGALAAFILTVAFPENEEFGATQVFGFLLLALVALGVTLGAVAAIVIDRMIGRRAKTVVVDRMNAPGSSEDGATDAASDSPNSADTAER